MSPGARSKESTRTSPARRRLDVALVSRGLAESREKAQALVMAGLVKVDGEPAMKPGAGVKDESALSVEAATHDVGRGASKLRPILERFGVDPKGRVAVDVGASTGGFTQVLLDAGAKRVYAVDVGRGQLHERVRADARVVVRDRVNARSLSPGDVPEPCAVATVDVSFISVSKILPALKTVLAAEGDAIVLVKPQFEVGRREVGRGGLVKDPEKHRGALFDVARQASDLGYAVRGAAASPITGSEGNQEFFLHLRATRVAGEEADLMALVNAAVEP